MLTFLYLFLWRTTRPPYLHPPSILPIALFRGTGELEEVIACVHRSFAPSDDGIGFPWPRQKQGFPMATGYHRGFHAVSVRRIKRSPCSFRYDPILSNVVVKTYIFFYHTQYCTKVVRKLAGPSF